jgi:hypothetical protein
MTRHERISATALLTVLVALLLVGLVSGTLISHALQVLPILLASVVVVLRPDWSKFAVIPIFAFWLFIMLLIWLYLLGIARVVTGHFTPAEVSLTVVIGLACVVGLGASARSTTHANRRVGLAAVLLFTVLQVGAMWLSLR